MAAAQKGNGKKTKAKRTSDARKAFEAEVRKNVSKIAKIEKAQRQNRTWSERVSEIITRFCGSMAFVWIHVAWFGGWIILNSVIPYFNFDPFPFNFLTMVVSLEAIFLSTFILITQNQETRMTERRNHLDLQINMLSEEEGTRLLEIVRAIADKVGAKYDAPDADALMSPVDPQRLVEEILKADGDDVEEVKPKK
jgi:uncharacterized membrane protein